MRFFHCFHCVWLSLYPRCEQETLELYKDCLIYREGRAEFFLLLFLVFLRSTCRHSRARERNGTSMGVAGRLLKGLADDVGRGVKWVGADVVFSFSRVETFVPPPLLLILRSSLPAKHDQSLFPATTPSLSLLLHPPPAVRQRRLPLRYFLLSSPPDDDDDYRERSHTRAAPRVRQGDLSPSSSSEFRKQWI